MNRPGIALAFGFLVCGAAPLDALDRFAGTWQSQGTFVDTPYSAAGTASGTTTCTWSSDHIFMICQQVAMLGGKRDDDVAIYSYDDASSAYRFYNVHASRVTSSVITVNGNTVAYPFTFDDKGKSVTIRTLNVWDNPNLYDWRTEYSADGGKTWTLMAKGTSRRVPPPSSSLDCGSTATC